MRLLAVISGTYGERHVENLRRHGGPGWHIEVWRAPAFLPPVIDDPEEFLPAELPEADLVLAFGEHPGVAELIPDVVRMSGAKAVVAAADREEWLPRGLARQLQGWLEEMGVACVAPRPLCTLTESEYRVGRREVIPYTDAHIAEFARYVGRPKLRVVVDEERRVIARVEVLRDAVCGCAHFVAEGLIGVDVDEAEEKAGLLHHFYPCLAGMDRDIGYGDTLMHVAGDIMKGEVAYQVKPFRSVQTILPPWGRRVDEKEDEIE